MASIEAGDTLPTPPQTPQAEVFQFRREGLHTNVQDVEDCRRTFQEVDRLFAKLQNINFLTQDPPAVGPNEIAVSSDGFEDYLESVIEGSTINLSLSDMTDIGLFSTTNTWSAQQIFTGGIELASLHLQDNEKLTFGNTAAEPDSQMYSDGTDTLWEKKSGTLKLVGGGTVSIGDGAQSEECIKFDVSGNDASVCWDGSGFNLEQSSTRYARFTDASGTIGNSSGSDTSYSLNFDALSGLGLLLWDSSQDYFVFHDDCLMNSTEKLQFRDSDLYIDSPSDGTLRARSDTDIQLDIGADTQLTLTAGKLTYNNGGFADVPELLWTTGQLAFGGTAGRENFRVTDVGVEIGRDDTIQPTITFFDSLGSGTWTYTGIVDTMNVGMTFRMDDDVKFQFGTSGDGSIDYDGANLEWNFNLAVNGAKVIWNNDGFDADFIIEGDTDPDLFYLDAGNDRVGISTSTPSKLLHVAGDAQVDDRLHHHDYASVTIDNDAGLSSAAEINLFDEDNYTTFATTANVTASGVTYTSTDGRFTVDNAGIFLLVCTYVVNAASSTLADLIVKVNGSAVHTATIRIHSSVDPVERTVSIIKSLSATDYVEFFIDTAGANVDQSEGTTANLIRFS